MSRRVLIVQGDNALAVRSVEALCTETSGLSCEFADWSGLDLSSLRDRATDLIVAVIAADDGRARDFLLRLRDRPLLKPTFAILLAGPSAEFVRLVASAVDDFMFHPVRPDELRERMVRLVGPIAPGGDEVGERLTRELGLAQLVGCDAGFLRVVRRIPLVARAGAPVLVTGETGTGKELCARAIHHLSRRRDLPFIAVDCAALPDHLFENEMFGHARGAFTDAHRDQRGLIAIAQGGTVFLDEVDSLSVAAQAKLLRFLQERRYKPLGAEGFARADVNVIAASNRDLEALVEARQFRADLFFRLNVLRLHMIPLRERRGDIELLARHFVAVHCAEVDLRPKKLRPSAISRLALMDWPGNVRELHNMLQRAVTFSESDWIEARDILAVTDGASGDATDGAGTEDFRHARARVVAEFERSYVTAMLRRCNGNVTHAAREARQERRAFGRLAKKYGLHRHSA